LSMFCWSHSGLLRVTTTRKTIWCLKGKNNGKGKNVLELRQHCCIYEMSSFT
jgi:hypothetical protein